MSVTSTSSSRYIDDDYDDYSKGSDLYKDDKEETIKPEISIKPESPEPKRSVIETSALPKKLSDNNLSNAAKSRTTKSYASKKIDLGAAADYAKQHEKPSTTKATNTLKLQIQMQIYYLI